MWKITSGKILELRGGDNNREDGSVDERKRYNKSNEKNKRKNKRKNKNKQKGNHNGEDVDSSQQKENEHTKRELQNKDFKEYESPTKAS